MAPNDSVAFDLSFTPQADSTYADTLIIWCSGNQDSVLQVVLTGRGLPNGVSDDKRNAYPTRFQITDVSPNPFNSETTISFSLPQAGWTTIDVVDVNGRVVSELARGQVSAGRHSMTWNAKGVPAGIYLVRLQAGGEAVTRKVVLLK